MATQGFEFARMLDRGSGLPLPVDFTLGVAAEHLVGDLMKIQSDGYIDAVAGSIDEVTCVMAEYFAAADVTAGTTKGKALIIGRNQVWRCSTDASTATTALVGYIKTWDTVDKNTIDASDITNGSMIVVDVSETDDEGNVLGHVVFSDTTFGNA